MKAKPQWLDVLLAERVFVESRDPHGVRSPAPLERTSLRPPGVGVKSDAQRLDALLVEIEAGNVRVEGDAATRAGIRLPSDELFSAHRESA